MGSSVTHNLLQGMCFKEATCGSLKLPVMKGLRVECPGVGPAPWVWVDLFSSVEPLRETGLSGGATHGPHLRGAGIVRGCLRERFGEQAKESEGLHGAPRGPPSIPGGGWEPGQGSAGRTQPPSPQPLGDAGRGFHSQTQNRLLHEGLWGRCALAPAVRTRAPALPCTRLASP